MAVGVWAALAAGAPSAALALLCWEEWAWLCEQALRSHRSFQPAKAFPSAGDELLRLGRRCDRGLA